jgi:hypothetical protein
VGLPRAHVLRPFDPLIPSPSVDLWEPH